METEPGTRAQLARLIGQEGPITVACLAERLSLTTAAVRRHLDAMLADGQISARQQVSGTQPRGRGRPARAYVLTEVGQDSLVTAYDHLAAQALEYIAQHGGRESVAAFAQDRVNDLERRIAPRVDSAGDDVGARVEALAAALDAEGYAASSRPVGTGTPQPAVQLCQGHCPVQQVAEQFPELCEAETDAFARLLGVPVRRLATLAHGDHVCTTHVPTQIDITSGPDRHPAPERTTTLTTSGRTAR